MKVILVSVLPVITVLPYSRNRKTMSLKLCLRDIIWDVKDLNTIAVCEIEFSIYYLLSGDWNLLTMITGIDSATATHTCIWCKCPAIERYTLQVWSISDINFGARSIEENTWIASSRVKKYNVSHPPLFPTTPLTRAIVDNLHVLKGCRYVNRFANIETLTSR